MEFGQKFGAALLMIIPAMLGGVWLNSTTGSWILTIIWVILMAGVWWAIITGKIFGRKAS